MVGKVSLEYVQKKGWAWVLGPCRRICMHDSINCVHTRTALSHLPEERASRTAKVSDVKGEDDEFKTISS